jgi:hypothetical protein
MVLQAGCLVFVIFNHTAPVKNQKIKEMRCMQLCIVEVIRDSCMRWFFSRVFFLLANA